MSEQLKSRLRQMSTEQLEEILRFDVLSEDGIGESFSSAIVDVLKERNIENGVPAVDVGAKWKVFCENYLPYAKNGSLYLDDEELERSDDQEVASDADSLKQNNSFGKARNPKRKSLRVLSRAAVSVAAVVILFFSGIGIADAAGLDAWEKVASWTEEIFTFRDRGGNLEVSTPTSHEPDGTGNYASLQEALDAYGITDPIAPKWIPKGYNAEEVVATTTTNGASISAVYVSDEKLPDKDLNKAIYIDIFFDSIGDGILHVQKDAEDPGIYESCGIEHYIMTNTGDLVAVWQQGGYECTIGGNSLSTEELKEMIDSIYWRH